MKRLLLSLYGFAFFNKFLLLTPVYTIFMLGNGVSDFQLSTMFIISSLGTILGQGPIALMANRFGRRITMIFGQILKMIAILLWLYVPIYSGFVVGMLLWGVQAGARSVAFEGLVYDTVRANGDARDYSRILGRKSTYEALGVTFSAAGSLLMFLGYDWVTWMSVFALLISIVCLLLFPNCPHYSDKNIPSGRIFKLIKIGFKLCMKTPCLLSIMLFTILMVNIPFLDDFLSPIGLQLGIRAEYVGIVSFFLLLCATTGQRLAYRFSRISDMAIYFLVGLVGALYIWFASIYAKDALWILGIAYMVFYGLFTLLYSRFQHIIPRRNRTIILSLYTTLTYLVYICVCAIIGLGSNLGSWRFSIMILGAMLIVLSVWGIGFLRRRCKICVGSID